MLCVDLKYNDKCVFRFDIKVIIACIALFLVINMYNKNEETKQQQTRSLGSIYWSTGLARGMV